MLVCLAQHLVERFVMVLGSRLTDQTPSLQFFVFVADRAVGVPPKLEVDDCAFLRFAVPEDIAQTAVHWLYTLSVYPSDRVRQLLEPGACHLLGQDDGRLTSTQ